MKRDTHDYHQYQVDSKQTYTEKKNIVLLQFGIDKFTYLKYMGLGKVWGEVDYQFSIHDFMSLQRYNYLISFFLGKMECSLYDPF